MTSHPRGARWQAIFRITAVLVAILGMFGPLAQITPAYAASITSAVFTPSNNPSPNTAAVGGVLYARSGAALTLTVVTDTATNCVAVSGSHSATSTSSTTSGGLKTWTFSGAAFNAVGGPDGVRTVTVQAREKVNCTGAQTSITASYIVDTTGPAVTGAITQQSGQPINAAGWANSNVSISWSATDAGSGVAGSPNPASDTYTSNTSGFAKTSGALDRVGNPGVGQVTVKLDKNAPTLSPTLSGTAGSNGWYRSDVAISWNCADGLSGIKSCTGGGTTTVTGEGANLPRTGQAVDNADNSASANVTVKIDRTAPTLSGAPTSANLGNNGWYRGNVTITWACGDTLSGIPGGACPADSTLSSEGTGLTASASVSDAAGNSSGVVQSQAVNIDTTAPNTIVTAPANWNNSSVTVNLDANDALSGVSDTFYRLNGGAQQGGSSVTIDGEGVNTLEFWSVDKAGNQESPKTVTVKIDQTEPEINHTLSPAANPNGWNNSAVTVTFTCVDGGSGIASCTAAQQVATEGLGQLVVGTATDNAGNSALDPATVNIDLTPPTIVASADRAPNGAGWYNDNVTVSFQCDDELAGIASCSAPETMGEGANQSADGEAADAAGNTSPSVPLLVNVDKTSPTLTGALSSSPNGAGWYNGDVTVAWSCSDGLSGLAESCPAASTVTGEGDNLGASAAVGDLAGNSATAAVGGIKIDRTAPSTLASAPAPLASGWYAGDVQVTLTTGADLSGVAATSYQLGDGQPQNYSGPFTISAKGVHTITFWSADNAGNIEDRAAPGHTITLKIDGVAPTITGSRSPLANGFGWNNVPVLVSFACEDAESGIAGCEPGLTLGNEGQGQSYTGSAIDNAGNSNSATVSGINIDLTAPTLSGAPTTPDNAAGWYNGDVVIAWAGQDALSGIDPATQPGNSTITGEGSNLGAGPVTIADKAGNLSLPATISGIKIDRTPPTISGAPTSAPNAAGWYSSAVTVSFSCADPNLKDGTAGSGVANCSDNKVLSGDGANQSATSDVPNDNAGNSGAASTVSGIKIDGQAPQTTAVESCTSKNGWCRGNKATVVLTAVDQAGLSGVKEIRYKINGGAEKTASGATVSVDVPLAAQSGLATLTFYAVDMAGNAESQGGVSLRYDNLAPTVTHTQNPVANAADWNNTDVALSFSATDEAGGSGVDADSWINKNVTITSETAGQTVVASVEDMAGNPGSDSALIKIDRTRPTISGVAPNPNANGWYRGAVTISWTCADAGAVQSGVTSCSAADIITSEGAGQSRTGAVSDRAGNGNSATVSGINIDATAPEISLIGLQATYTLGQAASLSCAATDRLSGLDGACSVSVTGGNANGVGTFSYTATATDKAGNVATVTGSFKVQYRFDGFLQPIDDPRLVANGLSVFKGGSTVPVKFQLKNAAGQPVQTASLPSWLNPSRGTLTTASIDESAFTDAATSGNNYRWDSAAQQYIFNWSTKGTTVGYYYRIGVMLDDGQSYYVSIALR